MFAQLIVVATIGGTQQLSVTFDATHCAPGLWELGNLLATALISLQMKLGTCFLSCRWDGGITMNY